MPLLHFATSSWNYDSWEGIIYPKQGKYNQLEEYAKFYDVVEVDRWFYALPNEKDVLDYKNSVPGKFQFIVKVPEFITLPIWPPKQSTPFKKNPNFLSIDIYLDFLKRLKPIIKQIPFVIFQFRYLNKDMIPDLQTFQNYFMDFFEKVPKSSPQVAVETRNSNYLSSSYFQFLDKLKLTHVFSEKIQMPSIASVYEQNKKYIKGATLIRLLGDHRSQVDKLTGENWSKIWFNKDEELKGIVEMIKDLQKRKIDTYVNVNNHYEGSAPLTIKKIKKLMEK